MVGVRAARVDLAEAEVDAAIRLVEAPDLHVEELLQVAALDQLEHRRVPDPPQITLVLADAGLRPVSGMLGVEERQPRLDIPLLFGLVKTNFQSFLLSAQDSQTDLTTREL